MISRLRSQPCRHAVAKPEQKHRSRRPFGLKGICDDDWPRGAFANRAPHVENDIPDGSGNEHHANDQQPENTTAEPVSRFGSTFVHKVT